ncbi:uncharacterized protein [Triticum aestivum]|uniref:uncharacterized protein n=1 Tax=Triticum aestivum TaxID=4565 RepID=UPI001D03011F|nr:uncharacterized protein LOC123188824 [Triticum aestivum]
MPFQSPSSTRAHCPSTHAPTRSDAAAALPSRADALRHCRAHSWPCSRPASPHPPRFRPALALPSRAAASPPSSAEAELPASTVLRASGELNLNCAPSVVRSGTRPPCSCGSTGCW